MKRYLASLLCLCAPVLAEESQPVSLPAADVSAGVNLSLANEARAAMRRGMDWLVAQQNEAGHWSVPDYPALTALPLWALAQGRSSHAEAIQKARDFILSCVREDGSICREPAEKRKGGGLCNYNTALCMVALHALGDSSLTEIIQKARAFVASGQHFGGDIYEGGMGYDAATDRPYADLSNSYMAYEAMRMTESVEDLRKAGDPRADLDWESAQRFISRIQNLPESNDQPWARNATEEDRGGFAYRPDSSMAGAVTNESGGIRFRSYGSMTYAGLLSFIYARVDKSDPRVASAFDWAMRHWTLDENPGMGAQGMYYFFNVLSKGLAAYGQDVIPTADGPSVNWREALIQRLVSLQKVDPKTGGGYWVNDEGRWMENDPILVTSYSILAMQLALGH